MRWKNPLRVESYYTTNKKNPYWQGEKPYVNKDGTKVEGAVMQTLWDIWDYKDINDGDAGWDDEGINGLICKMWKIISKYEPNNITSFWEDWKKEGYPNIDEMKFCNIYGRIPPKPTNLVANYSNRKVFLSWRDNSTNEGYFILYRQENDSEFTANDIIARISA